MISLKLQTAVLIAYTDQSYSDLPEDCKDLIEYFKSFKTRENEGLKEAALQGNTEVINIFISKGANDWNGGLRFATKGGHKNLIEFFLEKGAFNVNEGLFYSARRNDKDLIEFFLRKGANSFFDLIDGACFGGHTSLVKTYLETAMNAVHPYYFSSTARWFESATKSGNRQLVNFFLENDLIAAHDSIRIAAKSGDMALVKYILQKYGNSVDLSSGLMGAVSGGHKKLCHFFIDEIFRS